MDGYLPDNIQRSKYWILTSPHMPDVPRTYPGLRATFEQAARPVKPLLDSFQNVIDLMENEGIIYDYIVSVEDGNHIHAYLEFVRPVNLLGYRDLLDLWNFQMVMDNDKSVQQVKEYVRKDGFWKQKNSELPVVYENEDPEWRAWQQRTLDSLDLQNDREILFVFDRYGNKGKSFLASWFSCRRRASYLPATLKTSRDLLRVALDRPSHCYFVDFPKCVSENSIPQVFAAVESIKNGHVYDDRYEYRDLFMDHPKVCVFGNFEPDRAMLSADRWTVQWL